MTQNCAYNLISTGNDGNYYPSESRTDAGSDSIALTCALSGNLRMWIRTSQTIDKKFSIKIFLQLQSLLPIAALAIKPSFLGGSLMKHFVQWNLCFGRGCGEWEAVFPISLHLLEIPIISDRLYEIIGGDSRNLKHGRNCPLSNSSRESTGLRENVCIFLLIRMCRSLK